MKKHVLVNLLVAIGTMLYILLFWQEKMGINTLIFAVFLIASLFTIHPTAIQSKTIKIFTFGTLLTAVIIVWHNSFISKLMHILSFLCLTGFIQKRELRFIGYAFLLGIMSILETPRKLIRILSQLLPGNRQRFKAFFRYFKLAMVPLIILSFFFFIYILANPKFAELSNVFFTRITSLFALNFSFEQIVFAISGLFISGGILWKSKQSDYLPQDTNYSEQLVRTRNNEKSVPSRFSLIDLKNEYRIAMMVIVSLNILLFIVNLIDIRYVWFGFEDENVLNLKTYVHEGTYLLIFAILLAMGILLYYFRKNLNFFSNNGFLKKAAYGWIIQNAILTFSVAIRNSRYIDYHGLAYKRIGVMIFLILTLFGLVTLFFKIKEKKNLNYLIHRNSWAVYIVLIASCLINWDVYITSYNLRVNTKSNIDTPWLLEAVSDKNLFLLLQHRDILATKSSYPSISKGEIDTGIISKTNRFQEQQMNLSWLSWNYSDYRNKQYLSNINSD